MNLLFASNHCCIRVVKEGLALARTGDSVVFFQNRIANVDVRDVLSITSFWGNLRQYGPKLQVFANLDLIHVHNEPSRLVTLAKEAHPDTPVIFDVHDLAAVRNHQVVEEEVRAFQVADGIIWPSEGYRDYCENEFAYHFKGLKDKPSAVVYSMCTSEMMEFPAMPRLKGIVYEGRVSSTGDEKDYRGIIDTLVTRNVPFYVLPSNMNDVNEYIVAGAVVMPTMPYAVMMRALSRFDWGFCGPAVRSRQGDRGMGNKLFEYLAAGIPVIVHQSHEQAAFVERNDVGVVVNDINEIPDIYDLHQDYREVVIQKRHQFAMEHQLGAIRGLYNEVLGRGAKPERQVAA